MRKFFLALAFLGFVSSAYAESFSHVNTNQASMSASAAIIVASRSSRHAVTIINTGTVTVFLGNSSSVTTADGFPLPAGEAITLNSESSFYGVTASSTATVGYIETYP